MHDPRSLVDELMRISLSAEAASKLMLLIGKSMDFDVEALSDTFQKKSPEERQKELSDLVSLIVPLDCRGNME